jgi:hypothetical protein
MPTAFEIHNLGLPGHGDRGASLTCTEPAANQSNNYFNRDSFLLQN